MDGRGPCTAGARTCIIGEGDTTSAWSGCEGAVGPAADDSCTVPGDDSDCDGIPNGGCSCLVGQTLPCGPATEEGICVRGFSSCLNGVFSECQGAVFPVERNCDSSQDNDCDGRPDDTTCCADDDCQPNAACNGNGTCGCRNGFKPCGSACIPNAACCDDNDCPDAATCRQNACICDDGLFGRLCDGQFVALGIPNAQQTSVSAVAISDDGRVVTGNSSLGDAPFGAFRWDGSYESLGLVTGFDGFRVSGMNGDGSTIVGTVSSSIDSPSLTARWTRLSGLQALDLPVNGTASGGRGVSSNNSMIFGTVRTTAVTSGFGATWINGSFTAIPNFETPNSQITAANAEGSILGIHLVGRVALAVRTTGATTLLPPPAPPTPPGNANDLIGLSDDGTIAVGSITARLGSRVYLWRSGASAPEDLGAFIAQSMTGDGRIIVGSSSSVAILWDATNGIRNIDQILTGAGADLQGLTLISANDISRDGRFLVGDALRNGRREPWLARLPTP